MKTNKQYSRTISIYNGNGKRYTLTVPRLFIKEKLSTFILSYLKKQTGMSFEPYGNGYMAQPKTFKQLYKLFARYNFTTTFYDNASWKNVLSLELKK